MTQEDVPQVQGFLAGLSEYVMFPLNNLVRFGLDGNTPLAPRMWRNDGGQITDILSVTKAGMVMPYLPSEGFAAAAACLTGRDLIGVIGPKPSAVGIQDALGMTDVAMALDADEAHFSMQLADLVVPDGPTRIVPADERHRAILTEWMVDYNLSLLGAEPDEARKSAPERLTQDMAEGRRVVLLDGETPVATTAFNAALPEIVQVGGVYAPPALRGQGHARRAVGLHLAQAKAAGTKRATLFANDPSAIAAYSAVGFKRFGDWKLTLFKSSERAQ